MNKSEHIFHSRFQHLKHFYQFKALYIDIFIITIINIQQFEYTYQTWCLTWAVSNFVSTKRPSFALGCSHSGLKGLGDFSEETRVGILLHCSFPVCNHFFCDFDNLHCLLGFLWSFLVILVIVVIIRTGLLHANHNGMKTFFKLMNSWLGLLGVPILKRYCGTLTFKMIQFCIFLVSILH